MHFGRMSAEELVGAFIFVAIGIFVTWEATNYPMGTLRAMGPGFFPFYLGLLMSGLSILHIVERVIISTDEHRSAAWRWRPAIAVMIAIVAFGFLFSRIGLVPSIFVLVFVSGLGHYHFRPMHLLLVSIALAIFAYMIFIYFLQLPLTPFGRLPLLSELN